MSRVAVLDIGKTNVKVAVVDTASGAEVAVRKMPNRVRPGPPYPHYDTEAHWAFLLRSLQELGAEHELGAIAVTTHGATGVLIDADGALALPVIDYEHDGPDRLAAEYDALRPSFEETGTPRLPCGLNLGAQLFWQMRTFPEAENAATFLTYPQYWSWQLTGVAAVEATSLGCHTDLWAPDRGSFSSLVDGMNWRRLMPPVRKATEVLGPLRPDLVLELGLPELPVLCGIHDSNASLYPHLLRREPPFSVVSTGTWVVCMAVGGRTVRLDPTRDTLVNVNALGDPVPSARFMGGREYELVRRGRELTCSEDDVARVLEDGVMLLPAVEPGSGPFRGRQRRWTREPEDEGQEAAALGFYLALMTATCLVTIGAEGPCVVEGPFAASGEYLKMLAAATGRPVIPSFGITGTAAGAALLSSSTPNRVAQDANEVMPSKALAAYADAWLTAVAQGCTL
ncbi:FGGY-family carbohydrate kinase [Tranquillimonas alkanivorans]|uniref:Sugar (Pentulose or hexulose) kinase n=1 Tax=Tranquillimonas alkanivorans TaxID=441119 RepID=A0A1I5Q6B7_9RHOB|nr:FGGY-family carbohydrate kinase [Tranquillimonas alkanivorans]SFP41894.1 Sugar (pentulose or hexulose) kinase [Tranquillimonas alkanivorans]